MCPMAIIGAAGFVGSRMIETCMLAGHYDLRPIVRNNYSLARICRFGLQDRVRMADAENGEQLLEALRGCRVVVNLVSGEPSGIVNSTKVIHRACINSGVRRLIHLSSAVVYGRVESSATHDDSPLEKNHWMPYARAKIAAEHYLREVQGKHPLEVAVLRPGIVWGPRSRWSLNAAAALKGNGAYLVGDGSGICNTIYIDNLVTFILRCCSHTADVSGFYNVADDEVVTWRDFYASLADHFAYDMSRMRRVTEERFEPTFDSLLADLTSTWLYRRLKKSISAERRFALKQWLASLKSWGTASVGQAEAHVPKLIVSREMWNLQKTAHKLPTRKFADKFKCTHPVSFLEGTRMTVNWLRFLGYEARERSAVDQSGE